MKTPILFALALFWVSGILAQEAARENEITEKATAVPATIDFQGRLHDSSGNPVNATLDITFSLYDVLSGGTALWTETKSVLVTDGLFQVKLGEVTPFTPSHFSGTDRWLGMQVGTEAEMSPRTKISSVGYALQALEADPSWEGNPNPTDAIGRAGNVGIGITAPLALLHTHGTGTDQGNVVFVGEYKSTGGIFPPVSGAGTRLMWYPDKAIFRLGMVNGTQWDPASMGHFSVAMGKNTTASGYGTVAFGDNTIASGSYASALGYGSTAEGSYAVAMGSLTNASGNNSLAMGSSATASGSSSFAMGSGTIASGDYATVFGYFSNAPSYCETVFGKYNTSYTPAGINTWEPTDRLFVVANGTEYNARSNALTILKNGKTGIGTANPAALLHTSGTGIGEGNVLFVGAYKATDPGDPPVSGAGTRMMWYPDKGAFRAGEVSGAAWDKENIGNYSVAFGRNTYAPGQNAVALGGYTDAQKDHAFAMGYNASAAGAVSTAIGYYSEASGNLSTALGYFTVSPSYNETTIGRYNLVYTPASATTWETNDRLFVIGNGTAEAQRSNALTILKNGNTGIGISNPANRLEVAGQVKITGGNPGAGKVLTSDPSGLASWQTPTGLTLPFSGSGSVSSAIFEIENTGTDEESANIGIIGRSISGIGVRGEITGPTGTGISGFSSATSGSAKAISGQVIASGGYSGYFLGGRFFVEGNTGIGTQNPSALLHTHGTGIGEGNVLFIGEAKTDEYAEYGPPPVSGAGTRMMWYPDKGAFRAGKISGLQWDEENIGFHSIAFGSSTKASGYISSALGGNTIASGTFSSSFGRSTEASGDNSTAMGNETIASGSNTFAAGYLTIASGYASFAMGRGTTAPSYCETSLGSFNSTYTPAMVGGWNATDRLFVIGNGSSSTSRSNAITVLKNGNTGLGTDNPAYKLEVIGSSRIQLAKTSGEWIALRTDGNLLDFSFSGHPLAIQGMAEGEDIVLNPSRSNKVGIRMWLPMYDLDVNGNIRATGSVFYGGTAGSANGTAYTKPDYVFEESYDALDPFEVEEFLLKEKHLPWITSAEQEKQENGEVTDMTRMAFETVETVENLQLQIIEQQKTIHALLRRIEALEREMSGE